MIEKLGKKILANNSALSDQYLLGDIRLHDVNKDDEKFVEQRNALQEYLKALSLCHTVTIDKEGNYSAASPDELAFVQFTDDAGHHYVDKDD